MQKSLYLIQSGGSPRAQSGGLLRVKSRGLSRAKSRGFALLYVVLMIGIISITMTAISVSNISGLRQAKQVKNTTGAYQVAQAGLEKALTEWESTSLRSCTAGALTNLVGGSPNYGQYITTICDGKVEVKAIYKGNKIGLRANILGAGTNNWPDVSSVEQIGN